MVDMQELRCARIHITGVVQGVGFRPFVYNLARQMDLTGWVRNTSAGVDIEVDGPPSTLQEFLRALRDEAPPLARIDEFDVAYSHPNGFSGFEILHSEPIPEAFQPISPDVSICPDCLQELFDPKDRRYRYPFINCTNCGPRFTIIKDIPYDRPLTTMAGFPMCPDCLSEYENPLDRRFHAQPVACPECGPHIWLEVGQVYRGDGYAQYAHEAALSETRSLLAAGKIIAIKGLGGFHLACDAANQAAVIELRRRKLRVDKPFALMLPDLKTIEAHCYLHPAERELLASHPRPIVILKRRPESTIAPQVAPGQDTLGIMLPYSPLHYLLFSPGPMTQATEDQNPGFQPLQCLVMTSGNLCDEPIAIDNEEARQRLSALADAFLMHDRPIHTRCDDSVVRVFARPPSPPVDTHQGASDKRAILPLSSGVFPLRRSRGYAPFPVHLPWKMPPILAYGPELKNTFCLTHGQYAFLSHHIGDLENYETLRSFEDAVRHYEHLFRVTPQTLACDLHPDYLATRYALERAASENLTAVAVQHHHAHIAACLAEHALKQTELSSVPLIGISFDGAGYGEDGAIWGGEFLLADYRGFKRVAHLTYLPLAGGAQAIHQPWRQALSLLRHARLAWDTDLPPVRHVCEQSGYGLAMLDVLQNQLEQGLNSPPTSSMGRLFDAVAALVGVRQIVNYEAQAAIELEALVDVTENGYYSFAYLDDQISPAPLAANLIQDLRRGIPVSKIAARFHNAVARMVLEVSRRLRDQHGSHAIALSGGVWQNMTLLTRTCQFLQEDGFRVLVHQQVPTNDGGISLGQAVIAAHQIGAIQD